MQHKVIQIATKYKSSWSGLTTSSCPRSSGQCYFFPCGVILSGPGLCQCYLHLDLLNGFPLISKAGGGKEGARGASGWDMQCIKCVSAVVCYISGINAGWCTITGNAWPEAERENKAREKSIDECTHDRPWEATVCGKLYHRRRLWLRGCNMGYNRCWKKHGWLVVLQSSVNTLMKTWWLGDQNLSSWDCCSS